ncbi:MAG: hypothetical protein MUW56_14465 [Chryseobacterium sp.]|uniref:hypothetical protein n=1 Tax=Chryseobacterium sp. TaxID=1871047 RepID=UPI0025BF74E9|nr:hypothetical protein [Chryseobacterium sp.]MCJ7934790.1 hypothetical protein [Chryseobacterium sp.]
MKFSKGFITFLTVAAVSCGSNRMMNLPQELPGKEAHRIHFSKNENGYIHFSKEVNYIPYYLEVYQADSLSIIGKNQEAFEKLDKLFKVYEPLNQINYEEYKNYLTLSYLTDHKSSLKENTLFFIKRFGYPYNRSRNDSIMGLIFKENEIDENLVALENNKLLKKINTGLRDTLADIYKKDQYYRMNISDPVKMDSIDQVNEKILVRIFKKYGVPDEKLIGTFYMNSGDSSYANSFYIPLLHTKDSIRLHYFIPILKKAVAEGKFSPTSYANMIDQYYLYGNKKQMYGSYLNRDYTIAPVQNEKQLDSLRKSIGLPSVSNYLWKNKAYFK